MFSPTKHSKDIEQSATGNQPHPCYSCAVFDLVAEYIAKNLRAPLAFVSRQTNTWFQ